MHGRIFQRPWLSLQCAKSWNSHLLPVVLEQPRPALMSQSFSLAVKDTAVLRCLLAMRWFALSFNTRPCSVYTAKLPSLPIHSHKLTAKG